MKLSTSIAALIVGFSPAVLWAGAAADSAQDQPQTTQQTGAVSEPMTDINAAAGSGNTDRQSGTQWQYMNGEPIPSDSQAAAAQSGSEQGNKDQAASDQAASDQAPSDQAASDDQSSSGDQSANSENTGEEEQDLMANLPESQNSLGQAIQGIPGGVENKVVVILPRDWQGSLPDLIAALEQTSEAAEILVLKREGEEEDMSQNSDDTETSVTQ